MSLGISPDNDPMYRKSMSGNDKEILDDSTASRFPFPLNERSEGTV